MTARRRGLPTRASARGQPPRRWRAVAARVALVALAGGVALAPFPPRVVEAVYSAWVYPPLQELLTTISNLASFAFLDVAIVVLAVWWTWRLVHDLRGGKARGANSRGRASRGRRVGVALALALTRTIVLAAGLYLVFLVTWGLHYRRVPLADKVRFDPAAVSTDAVRTLAATAVQQVNRLYVSSREGNPPPRDRTDPALAGAFGRTTEALGLRSRTRLARPKVTLFDPYFRAAGVDGMTDPFFLETLVASRLLAFERPFVIAHEWGHLAGVADEGEANFVGWLTCVRGDERAQYSGWLFIYGEAVNSLPFRDRAAFADALGAGPRADLAAVADRLRREVHPLVADAGWRVYDRYLKANRVDAGTASYAQVVRLVVGTAFTEGWTPERR